MAIRHAQMPRGGVMKIVAAVLIGGLLTGCAGSMQDRRMNDVDDGSSWSPGGQSQYNPGLLALGLAMMQASGPHTLSPQQQNDFVWAWDLQRAPNGQSMWVCRGVQTGQYSDPAHCAYKPQIDSQWPGF